MIREADERRHQPGGPGWEERWWFDFAGPDVAGYVRLAYRPAERVAWWWAAVLRPGEPLVAVRAHDIRIPPRGTEVRADGVWAALICEAPLDHWSIGLESFGAAFDDPVEAWDGERGDVVPFGLDLEWEASEAPVAGRSGYGQWGDVYGDVLIGSSRIAVEASGHREHAWGAAEGPGWRVAVGGRWARDGGDLGTARDGRGLPTGACLVTGTDRLDLVVEGVSPVAVPDRRVVHAWCSSDRGWGWVTWRG